MSRRSRKNNGFSIVSITTGIILMVISLAIYFMYNVGYLASVQSKIFGVGAALFVIGIVLKIKGIKLT